MSPAAKRDFRSDSKGILRRSSAQLSGCDQDSHSNRSQLKRWRQFVPDMQDIWPNLLSKGGAAKLLPIVAEMSLKSESLSQNPEKPCWKWDESRPRGSKTAH